jgi:hypothetical protein
MTFERVLNLDRIGALLTSLRREAGLSDQSLLRMETHLIGHLADAMRRYSGLLEFSASRDGAATSAYRYSYSFPGFGNGEAERERMALQGMFFPFGEQVHQLAGKLLQLAKPSLVEQILIGMDARSEGPRYKLYFQTKPGAVREKLQMLRSLLDKDTLRETPEPYERLHLIGLDFDAETVNRVKLYFMYPQAGRDMLEKRFGAQPLVRALLDGPCPDGFLDFLSIRRIGQGGKNEGSPISELDFSLIANDLMMEDLLALDPQLNDSSLMTLWKRLSTEHRLVPTRVSLRPDDMSKLNLYYLAFDPAQKAV